MSGIDFCWNDTLCSCMIQQPFRNLLLDETIPSFKMAPCLGIHWRHVRLNDAKWLLKMTLACIMQRSPATCCKRVTLVSGSQTAGGGSLENNSEQEKVVWELISLPTLCSAWVGALGPPLYRLKWCSLLLYEACWHKGGNTHFCRAEMNSRWHKPRSKWPSRRANSLRQQVRTTGAVLDVSEHVWRIWGGPGLSTTLGLRVCTSLEGSGHYGGLTASITAVLSFLSQGREHALLLLELFIS